LFDGAECAWQVCNDLVVIHSKNFEPLATQEGVFPMVSLKLLFGFVTDTIDLDDDTSRQPGEVSDVAPDGRLPAKACSAGSEQLKIFPHFLLANGRARSIA